MHAIDLWTYASDVETPDSSLAFTIVSSTAADAGVSIEANQFININPTAGWTGSSTVTVRVSDGTLTATDVFVVSRHDRQHRSDALRACLTSQRTRIRRLAHAIDLWTYASDAETADSGLTFTITGITNASAGVTIEANRYINVSPAANWNGTSTVTVRVSDGSLTASDSFVVTVNAVNDPPAFISIPDVTTPENTPVNNAVDLWAYASDAETADSGLTFSVVSVVPPQAGATLDSNRYIDVSPTTNWNGASVVTVEVSDGSATGTRTFNVIVTPVNQAPIITHTPMTTGYVGTPIVIDATISDPESTPTAIVYYRTVGAPGYTALPMTHLGSQSYTATIPGAAVTLVGVQYYITATDGVLSDTEGPFTITISPAPDTQAPVVSGAAAIPNQIIAGVDLTLTLSAFADDASSGNSNIAAAEYFIGADPGAGSGTAMTSIDGAFNETSESVTATVDTSSWSSSASPYVVYVRARDAAGNWSPAAAVFVTVIGDAMPPAAVTDLRVTPSDPPMWRQVVQLAATVAEVSSEAAPGSAANVVDGNTASSWATAGTTDNAEEYVTLDLGGHERVGRVTVWPATPQDLFPVVIKVKASNDDVLTPGMTWRTMATAYFETAPASSISFAIGTAQADVLPARFIRIEVEECRLDGGGFYAAEIAEVEVFEERNAANAIRLTWTAPGDDGSSGTAWQYDLRTSAAAITAGNFTAATQVTGEPAPQSAGSPEWYQLNGLTPNTRYWLGLKTADEVPNWSAISNVIGPYTLSMDTYRIALTGPADETSRPVSSIPIFTWEANRFNRFWIEFSNSPSWPASPVTLPSGQVLKTLSYSVGTSIYSWTATASQWRTIKALTSASGGVLFWRVRGLDTTNPGMTGDYYSDQWHVIRIEGGWITPVAPANGTVINPASRPTFQWMYSGSDMVKYYVEFCNSSDFAASGVSRLSFPNAGVSGFSFTPTAANWASIKALGPANGGTVWWRVKGVDASGTFALWSGAWTFVLDGGEISLLPPIPNGDRTVPGNSSSCTFRWTYTGSGYSKFYVRFSVTPDFSLTGADNMVGWAGGVAGTQVTIDRKVWDKVNALAPGPDGRIYWQVKAVDADGAFYEVSPADWFVWQ